MGLISWIVIGLLAGLLARWIMPGEDPGGIFITIQIGRHTMDSPGGMNSYGAHKLDSNRSIGGTAGQVDNARRGSGRYIHHDSDRKTHNGLTRRDEFVWGS